MEIEKVKAGLPEIAGNFGFSEDEIAGGMDVSNGGYLSRYPLFVKASQNQFEVFDQRMERGANAVATLPKLQGVLLYGHPAYVLARGAVRGIDRSAWTDDDKKTVCMTYGSPWSKTQKSLGNFTGQYAAHIQDKALRENLSKRQYVFLIAHNIPGYEKTDIAVLSLGGTGQYEFSQYIDALTKQKLPVSFLQSEVVLENAKTEKGQAYFRPKFRPVLDDGAPVFATKGKTPDEVKANWQKHIVPIRDSVIAAHRAAMADLENVGPFSFDDGKPAPVAGVPWEDDEEVAF